jgi:hypothetical protein
MFDCSYLVAKKLSELCWVRLPIDKIVNYINTSKIYIFKNECAPGSEIRWCGPEEAILQIADSEPSNKNPHVKSLS